MNERHVFFKLYFDFVAFVFFSVCYLARLCLCFIASGANRRFTFGFYKQLKTKNTCNAPGFNLSLFLLFLLFHVNMKIIYRALELRKKNNDLADIFRARRAKVFEKQAKFCYR